MAWEPTNTRPIPANAIKQGDIVMNALGGAWLRVEMIDTSEGYMIFWGSKVLDMVNGKPVLGEVGRMSALFDDERILGW